MDRPTPSLRDTAARRLAVGSIVAFVAAFVGSVVLNGPPVVRAGQAGIEHSLSGRGLGSVFAGMFLLTCGLLAVLIAITYLAHAVGRRTAFGALAAGVAWAAGLAHVVVIAGVGLSAGAAAAWAQHQGGDLEVVLAVNNVRNFAYLAVLPFMGLCALGLGVAALADRVLTRWLGWGGVGVGVACLVAIPAAAVGVAYAMPLWLAWWLGVGIALGRHRTTATQSPDRAAVAAAVRHD